MVTLRPEFEAVRAATRLRMAQPDAPSKCGGRMAIVEPAFASLSDAIASSRASPRDPATVEAKVLLEILARHISRLLHGQRLRTSWLVIRVTEEDHGSAL